MRAIAAAAGMKPWMKHKMKQADGDERANRGTFYLDTLVLAKKLLFLGRLIANMALCGEERTHQHSALLQATKSCRA